MNVRNKIVVFIISFSVFINSSIGCYANARSVLTAVPITYELLTGLMAIGVSFGLALPSNDEEYWDYTSNLKKHLQVVDDDYLKLLNKTFIEWKTNNHNKKDDEKDPLKIPIIPGSFEMLKKLFSSIGNNMSLDYTYVNTLLDPIPLVSKYNVPINLCYPITESNGLDFTFVDDQGVTSFLKVTLSPGASEGYLKVNTEVYKNNELFYGSSSSIKAISTDNITYGLKANQYSGALYGQVNVNGNTVANLGSWNGATVSTSNKIQHSPYPYSPIDPGVENGELILPSSLPQVSLPGIETVPGKDPSASLDPPFDVDSPIDPGTNPGDQPGTNPGDQPGTNPGGGGSLPVFPPFGSGLDFTPITQSSFIDKFPFSLAKDIKNIVSVFDVEPKAPKFTVPIVTEELEIDLTQFNLWASIIRFFVLIGFMISLINITRKVIG